MPGSPGRSAKGNESIRSVMSTATAMPMLEPFSPLDTEVETSNPDAAADADPFNVEKAERLSKLYDAAALAAANAQDDSTSEEEEKSSGDESGSDEPLPPPRSQRPTRLSREDLATLRRRTDKLPAPPSTPNAQDQAPVGDGFEALIGAPDGMEDLDDDDLESSMPPSRSESSDNWSDLKPAPCARAKKVFSVAAPFTVSAILAAFIYLNVQMLMAREEGNQTDFEEDNTWITHFFPMIAVILSMKAVFSISDRKHDFSQRVGKCKDAMVIAAELVLILGFMLASLSQNALSLGFLDNATEELRNVTGETIVPALNAGASGNLLSFFLLLSRDAFSSSQKGALTVVRGSDAFLLSALMGHSALAFYDPAYAKDLITQQEVVLTLIASLFVANLATGVLASLQGCKKPKPASCCASLKGVRDDRNKPLLEAGADHDRDDNAVAMFEGCCP